MAAYAPLQHAKGTQPETLAFVGTLQRRMQRRTLVAYLCPPPKHLVL